MYIIRLMSKDSPTDSLRQMQIGDKIVMTKIERPNIHSLARRVSRQVKVSKQKDGSFVVECVSIYRDSA